MLDHIFEKHKFEVWATMIMASVESRNVDTVWWCIVRLRDVIPTDAFLMAIDSNDLVILRLLWMIYASRNTQIRTFGRAMKNGNTEIALWLCKQRCAFDRAEVGGWVERHGMHEVRHYLERKGRWNDGSPSGARRS